MNYCNNFLWERALDTLLISVSSILLDFCSINLTSREKSVRWVNVETFLHIGSVESNLFATIYAVLLQILLCCH